MSTFLAFERPSPANRTTAMNADRMEAIHRLDDEMSWPTVPNTL